jgi:hypothetical protein
MNMFAVTPLGVKIMKIPQNCVKKIKHLLRSMVLGLKASVYLHLPNSRFSNKYEVITATEALITSVTVLVSKKRR